MEELEKNQNVGESISQVGQTITTANANTNSSSSSSKRNKASSSTTTATTTTSPSSTTATSSGTARSLSGNDTDNAITKVTTQCEEAVSKVILKSIPSDSQIT
ncbi:MAG: hypothetical protein M3093_04200, partial [Thermoproteota archaeon]|nr:hypothetical protein [Thermoproteota archaeon]